MPHSTVSQTGSKSPKVLVKAGSWATFLGILILIVLSGAQGSLFFLGDADASNIQGAFWVPTPTKTHLPPSASAPLTCLHVACPAWGP